MYRKYLNQIKELQNFLILWISQSFSTLGSSMTSYAILIWVYQQKHSTMGVALLAVCTYLPSVLLSFLAGTFVDRHNKKKIILICDTIAAIGTISIFILMAINKLEVWNIYFINVLISVMNAFQTPADTVLVSGIVPQKYYLRIGGLQSISSSVVGIITPALATTLMTFVGINMIFIIDIGTFLFAFVSLLYFIEIPDHFCKTISIEHKKSYLQDCKEGFIFLKNHRAILQLILFFTVINLFAFIGGGGITSTVTAMILTRIPDGQVVLGAFSTAVAIGTLVGGVIVTFMKPSKNKIVVIFISCGVSFLFCDLSLGLSRNPAVWIVFNFLGNLPLSLLNANMMFIMRTTIPIEMQGRVFSARDTMQYCTLPLGYLLGGILADYIFEPFMSGNSVMKHVFMPIVGDGDGSGIALMFIFTGITGTIISLFGLMNKEIRAIDEVISN
jgi:Bacterial protein of unknown function (DUF894).